LDTSQDHKTQLTIYLTLKMAALASLEVARTFKRKDPESYQRLVKKLFFETLGSEYRESLFIYEETGRKDSAGCLSVIMHQKTGVDTGHGPSSSSGQDMGDQRVGSLYQVIEYLGLGVSVTEEGIFRKAGSIRKQQELLEKVERGEDLMLEEGVFNVHECASVLKTFLASLSEPLVTNACYQAHLNLTALKEEEDVDKRLLCTQLLLELIPDQYYTLLKDLLFLLNGVAAREAENKMSSSNLAMMFCTHVLCPKSLSAEDFQAKHSIFTKATTFMIENPIKLFMMPEKLLLEIQAFLSRRSSEGRLNLARRSNQGPGVECLIASTVFSFVDKEETVPEHNNPDKQSKDDSAGIVSQLESTVVSQLNLSIDILDIKNKQ